LWGQAKTITGEVNDNTGTPIPGVNVIVKNSSIGTVTDFDGKFSIDVPADAAQILVFSMIGYANKEVSITNETTLNI
ncbi:hypothetical protein E0702_18450, partial [Halomonas marinisediminis]